ncbi:hypothetical protein NC01_07915 [Streptococcus uberis]|nr:hypothetical protein NC01_07915 [Streptococcus uberis]
MKGDPVSNSAWKRPIKLLASHYRIVTGMPKSSLLLTAFTILVYFVTDKMNEGAVNLLLFDKVGYLLLIFL